MQAGGWIWAGLLVACFALLALVEAVAPGPARSASDRRLFVNFSLGTINIALGSARGDAAGQAASEVASEAANQAAVGPLSPFEVEQDDGVEPQP